MTVEVQLIGFCIRNEKLKNALIASPCPIACSRVTTRDSLTDFHEIGYCSVIQKNMSTQSSSG
jgi:hypothetical protein